jgi:hypothetical protein
MRPVGEVVRAIWDAWWAAALGRGGTIWSRFSSQVEQIIADDRREIQACEWDKPSEQTTVVDLRRREILLAAKAAAAAQSTARRQAVGSGSGAH